MKPIRVSLYCKLTIHENPRLELALKISLFIPCYVDQISPHAGIKILRQKHIQADVGISGTDLGVAETGMISITENEGNARLATSLPKAQISLMGIEKNITKLEDLALRLPMLATAGTGQNLTCYNSQFGGPS